MARELRQTLRSLLRSPWYSVAVVSVIALGMALSATVFAIVDGVLFKPLAYASPDRLFALSAGFSKVPDYDRAMSSISPAELAAWRDAVPDVGLTAFTSNDYASVGLNDSAPRASVDARFFDVIGTPILGRGFEAADFEASVAVPPAVITHEFWTRYLGGDPSAIGRTLVGREGHGIRVVGILPKAFAFPTNTFAPDVVTPLVLTNPRSRGRSLSVWVRLPTGATVADIAGRLTAAARTFAATAPATAQRPNATERARILGGPFDLVRLDPIRDVITSRYRPSATTAFAAAAVLVLLACMNVTGLATARVHDKWRDIVLRRALGAGYRDLVRQWRSKAPSWSAQGRSWGFGSPSRCYVPRWP